MGPKLLLTPGPLTTHPAVRAAMTVDWGSRDAAFVDLTREARARFVDLADRDPDTWAAVLLQGSGSYAVEAALHGLVPRNAGLLVCANGAYGRRMAEMARRAGHRVVLWELAEDEPVDPIRLAGLLDDDPSLTWVGVVHHETTTGLLNPIDAIDAVVSARGRRLLVDAMSAFGIVPMSRVADVIVASSNKGIEGPPGIGVVVARRAALEASAGRSATVALDVGAQHVFFERTGQWRFTPPTHVLAGTVEALRRHAEEGGTAGRGARYRHNVEVLKAGLRALGFTLLLSDAVSGPVIVTVVEPADPKWSFVDVYRELEQAGFLIYPGKLAVRPSFRVGCIGQVFASDVRRFLSALESTVNARGVDPTPAVPSGVPEPVQAPATPRALRAVVLDWAGTVVDHGCQAPAAMFVRLFEEAGLPMTLAVARGPMGTHKREHLHQLCSRPDVQEAWQLAHGRPFDPSDEDALFERAVTLQLESLPDHAAPFAGAVQAVAALRDRGLQIASTTGYTRVMLDIVSRVAATHGYTPDCAVAADEVSVGRPAPFLLWEALNRLGVYPASRVVKVGDTPVDMAEGRAAGAWCVGVTLTGNEVGWTEAEIEAQDATSRQRAHDRAAARLLAAGAHFVVAHLAQVPSTLDAIEARIAAGGRPDDP